jgi:hypothetical protein
VLSIISAANSDCCWAMVDSRALGLLEHESASWYLHLLKEKLAILIFKEYLSQAGNYGEGAVAVAQDDELFGLGTPEWFGDRRGRVEEILSLDLRKLKRKKDVEAEEGDELDFDM